MSFSELVELHQSSKVVVEIIDWTSPRSWPVPLLRQGQLRSALSNPPAPRHQGGVGQRDTAASECQRFIFFERASSLFGPRTGGRNTIGQLSAMSRKTLLRRNEVMCQPQLIASTCASAYTLSITIYFTRSCIHSAPICCRLHTLTSNLPLLSPSHVRVSTEISKLGIQGP